FGQESRRCLCAASRVIFALHGVMVGVVEDGCHFANVADVRGSIFAIKDEEQVLANVERMSPAGIGAEYGVLVSMPLGGSDEVGAYVIGNFCTLRVDEGHTKFSKRFF